MVVTISNALGLPVIVFSSASHYPIINITPCAAIPLYVAFNQVGASHYDTVCFNEDIHPTSTSSHPERTSRVSNCTCGRVDKHNSVTKQCTLLKFKYTTTIRCPCLSAGRPCTSLCTCHNCGNSKGVKPVNSTGKIRRRNKHARHTRLSKSVVFARQEEEKDKQGPRTLLEYILVSQIIKYCHNNTIDISLETVNILYTSCVEVVQVLEVCLPLGQKNCEEISKIVDEYEHNLNVFQTMCVTQLKLDM